MVQDKVWRGAGYEATMEVDQVGGWILGSLRSPWGMRLRILLRWGTSFTRCTIVSSFSTSRRFGEETRKFCALKGSHHIWHEVRQVIANNGLIEAFFFAHLGLEFDSFRRLKVFLGASSFKCQHLSQKLMLHGHVKEWETRCFAHSTKVCSLSIAGLHLIPPRIYDVILPC